MNTSEWIFEYLPPFTGNNPGEIPNWGRDDLASLFSKLGYKRILELGVEQGLYTEVLAKMNPQAEIIGVDAWTAYPGYREHVSQDKIDGFYVEAAERLAKYPNARLFKAFSDQAACTFKEGELDAVYLDSNHHWTHITHDIHAWWTKIRPGGILAGHDYRKTKPDNFPNHTVAVVHAFTQAFHLSPWFVLGRKDMIEGEVRDTARSWMIVKP
jgi:hypothetical protein